MTFGKQTHTHTHLEAPHSAVPVTSLSFRRKRGLFGCLQGLSVKCVQFCNRTEGSLTEAKKGENFKEGVGYHLASAKKVRTGRM